MTSDGFSVVLIARNEAATLPRLLASLKRFQNEGGDVLVTDTGSTDETPAVARRGGCNVVEVGQAFDHRVTRDEACVADSVVAGVVKEGDRLFRFADARNAAATHAREDWIMMPDADEYFAVLDPAALRRAIAAARAPRFSYDYVFARDGAGERLTAFYQSKLYDRRRLRWEGLIHEELGPPSSRDMIPREVLSIEHAQNRETDRTSYLRALLVQHVQNPAEPRTLHYLGRELAYKGDPRGIELLERHAAMTNADTSERSQSLIHAGELWLAQGDEEKATGCWFRSFVLQPERRDPVCRLALHFLHGKRWELAAYFAELARTIPPTNQFYANARSYYEELPDHVLYTARWWLGDRARAKDAYDRALAMKPHHPELLLDAQFFSENR